MLVGKVDGLDPEPFERALGHLPDVLGPSAESTLPSLAVELEPELGGDHHRLAKETSGRLAPSFPSGIVARIVPPLRCSSHTSCNLGARTRPINLTMLTTLVICFTRNDGLDEMAVLLARAARLLAAEAKAGEAL
jgi:hypothetical protein